MNTVTALEAKTRFGELINRVMRREEMRDKTALNPTSPRAKGAATHQPRPSAWEPCPTPSLALKGRPHHADARHRNPTKRSALTADSPSRLLQYVPILVEHHC